MFSLRIPRSSYQRRRSSIQYWCHSSSVPGTTKNSISICSNSRVRKTKLPGVISLRNDFPICAMPNGIFWRLVRWMVAKSTNMPCAVSGRSHTTAPSSSIGTGVRLEHQVEVARVGQRAAAVRDTASRERPGCDRLLEVVGTEARWHLTHSTSGSEKFAR
jgi:hypothetical protein